MLMNYGSDYIYNTVYPVKIIKEEGIVVNSTALLSEKYMQITTAEKEITTLINKNSVKNASVLLDFGKEYNGAIRILTYHADSEDTAKCRITYGESVSEALSDIGHKNSTNDHAIRDFAVEMTSYSDMTYTESGFRFVRIELISPDSEISIKSIVLCSKMRKVEYLGSFECDNKVLNNIYNTSAYTCHACMQQFIWDGIKRDRLVWIGDMHPEMLTVRSVFGVHPIIEESLRFMRNQTPLPCWMNGMPTYSLWWLHILYDWYNYSGNDDFLQENKDYALSLISIIINLVNEDGTDNIPSYFLDWPCNEKPQSISGSRALLALTLESASKLCLIFNQKNSSDECLRKKEILTSTTLESYGAKQVTAIGALSGWTDSYEAGKEILNNKSEGWSTFMSYYLLKASSCYNMSETLDALSEYYGAMLDLGATTFWEDFDISWKNNASPIDSIPADAKADIHGDFGKFCYKGLRHSLCHGWSSAPTAFLAEEVLGIRISESGCKSVVISPDLGNLTYAKGSYPTPYGNIFVDIQKIDNNINIRYSAPHEIKIITEAKYKESISYEFSRIS